MHLFVDARKLKHGGIGRYIENLILGLSSDESIKLSILCCDLEDAEFLKKICKPSMAIDFIFDNAKQYSFREYFVLPLKFKNLLKNCDWYIAPHYTLPYFISCKKAVVVHDCIHVTYPESFLHKVIGKKLIQSALRRANKVFTVSENSRDNLSREFKFPKDEILLSPNSLLPNFLNEQALDSTELSNVTKILFVSADKPHKRIELFLNFLALLKGAKFNFQAVILSKLSMQTKEVVVRNGLQDVVEVLGGLNNQELLDLYKSSDYLVTTSVEEGFCLPILEAMSLGLAVIAPRVRYSEELLEDAGWYFESGSASDLFRVFVDAFRDMSKRKAKCLAGVDRSKQFNLDLSTGRFIEALKLAV